MVQLKIQEGIQGYYTDLLMVDGELFGEVETVETKDRLYISEEVEAQEEVEIQPEVEIQAGFKIQEKFL